ncbi:hypothetical protein [Rubinisphaera brasiliensis]|uniref:Uncharacterized protein n=1 Tax=Rubinisphaera brasiliensis (strain ATCC 49424 / DSM 5305 / JCM 21570 / IAM 15109 / NBRC 103401 / IFAM 1448) TaxID=756272 RepID=F0SKS2_RUBBR|nr:hypothetical protein [Rubinisphaera brasiliensis]ADY58742.1 hypothetical protein Plabr_1126 [Rubinisphaera brasiliensis DSM 5305]
MGIMCSYKLWILGEDAKNVVKQLEDDGWALVSQSEMGAEFECEGKYLLRGSPIFRDYPHLVVVMSADNDAGMGFNHSLSAEQWGHHVSGFWPYDLERDSEMAAIETDGYDPTNVLSEALHEHGVEQTLRQFEGNSEWRSTLDSHDAYMASVKCEFDDRHYEQERSTEEEV